MRNKVAIGIQSFEEIQNKQVFYVDKTSFIKEWWENNDEVTLITRPRRFGKTLNISMLEQFFSVDYAGRGDLFESTNIWKEERYRQLQGTYPVLSIRFAGIKGINFIDTRRQICQEIVEVYNRNRFLMEQEKVVSDSDRVFFEAVSRDMDNDIAALALKKLSELMTRYYHKKVIILLDEYDTPMQEAYLNGYWNELVTFMGSLLNATFKTNPYLCRGVLTGITRVSKESIFSDLNNPEVVTTTSDKYADSFGFTQQEVSQALSVFGLSDQEEAVQDWYNGFTFGERTDIYNPWSIIHFLEKKKFAAYWANTSSNSLISKLIREGSKDIKITMENLLNGGTFHTKIDEQIVFDQLGHNEYAIWSLLLASGYLKVEQHTMDTDTGKEEYILKLTNKEVKLMFQDMIEGWFKNYSSAYNDFIKALLQGDKKAMNHYMNQIALVTFSSFDVGNKPSGRAEPERFYHGFVLGLIVELSDRFRITSNRESGFGRYDVMLTPKNNHDNAIILEFKVQDTEEEKTLKESVEAALRQINEKKYEAELIAEGIMPERIRKYGFAFAGKKCLIG
ncbi:MAG: AAA family ATPase [Lachnospiraceae bacterium]|mgnify:FL=1|nr:AAA family ATPase [Lachnospiraceae bacterium]MCI9399707.1 AAA family ATPase [Lachnospiraceae bacterium]MCX4374710.1 AAA family ATPase [Lachnospiraceae bacterium]